MIKTESLIFSRVWENEGFELGIFCNLLFEILLVSFKLSFKILKIFLISIPKPKRLFKRPIEIGGNKIEKKSDFIL
jgi:hypothetical protein